MAVGGLHACVRACVHACVRACVRERRARLRARLHAAYSCTPCGLTHPLLLMMLRQTLPKKASKFAINVLSRRHQRQRRPPQTPLLWWGRRRCGCSLPTALARRGCAEVCGCWLPPVSACKHVCVAAPTHERAHRHTPTHPCVCAQGGCAAWEQNAAAPYLQQ